MTVYLMRSPELPCFGEFSYKQIDVEEARKLISSSNFISSIQYQWDADLLRDILGVYIPINRGEIKMEVGDVAIVFSFLERNVEKREPIKKDAEKHLFNVGLLKRTS
jgi:hypothetical protein